MGSNGHYIIAHHHIMLPNR